MKINDPEIVKEVEAAFLVYEKALMEDDVEMMGNIFNNDPNTIRYGVGEMLYGYDEIEEFRKGRGGSPQRKLLRYEIATYGDNFATANAEFMREGGNKVGRQSQAWVRFDYGWKVVSAHVSIQGTTS